MTFRNPITAISGLVSTHNSYDYLGQWGGGGGSPLPTLDVSGYTSVIVIPTTLPGNPPGSFMQLRAKFGSGLLNTIDTGDGATWDTYTQSGLWIFDVKARYLSFAVTNTSSTTVGFWVYASANRLAPTYLDSVTDPAAAPFNGLWWGQIPATAGAGFASVPISTRAGAGRITYRAIGGAATNLPFLVPRRRALDPNYAVWIGEQGGNGDITDQFTAPNEPLAAAYYSAAAHPATSCSVTYL